MFAVFFLIKLMEIPARRMVYWIGRTMFESDGLQEHLVQHLLLPDEIWVPTEFNKRTFAKAGVEERKIFVLPEVGGIGQLTSSLMRFTLLAEYRPGTLQSFQTSTKIFSGLV